MKTSAYNDIMRELQAAQNAAHSLRERRQADLYKRFPRLAEIDRELAQTGLRLARGALAKAGTAASKDAQSIRTAHADLVNERAALLSTHGVPENYLSDVYQCAKCNDTGFVTHERQHCACLKQRLIDQYYSLSNLSGVLARENFSVFNSGLFSDRRAEEFGLSPRKNIELVRKEAERFIASRFAKKEFCEEVGFAKLVRKTPGVAEGVASADSPSNLLLSGPTGLGKTFICHCIAKAVLDAGFTVLYVTAPQLFKQIQAQQFGRGEADERLNAVTDADLLILDDLGAEFSTIVTDSALFDVVNQRLLDERATVISTNLTLDELKEQYTERIVSRFVGYYKELRFFGDDIRVKKRERSLMG